MKCGQCRQPITPSERSRSETIKDENGKIKEILHRKCVAQRNRRTQLRRRRDTETPTVYEQAASKMNKDDLTEVALTRRERAEEELENLREMRASAHAAGGDLTVTTDDGTVSLDDLIFGQTQEVELAKRQEEIAEQTELEERPQAWADFRDPTELEV